MPATATSKRRRRGTARTRKASALCPPTATEQPKRKRNRRSRSRRAAQEAAIAAEATAKAVMIGEAPMPKRNQLADVDVLKMKLKKMGPFWYSRVRKSPCYIDFTQFQILKRIHSFFEDPEKLAMFKKMRSRDANGGVSLRIVDNFYTNWCKTHCIITTQTEDFMLDARDDYTAMQAKHNKPNFDAFCRGKKCVLFETPPQAKHLDVVPVKPVRRPRRRGRKPKPSYAEFDFHGHGQFILDVNADPAPLVPMAVSLPPSPSPPPLTATLPETLPATLPPSPSPLPLSVPLPAAAVKVDSSDVRRVNGTTVGQAHFFYWLLNNEHYDLIVKRSGAIHRTMNATIQRNRQLKASTGCGKRKELTHETLVSHVIERPSSVRFT
jgi:hypothetical protein